MPNGTAHRLGAALVVGTVIGRTEVENGQRTAQPVMGASLAAIFANLPDVLEPAVHPHHRQFFHSIFVAGAVGVTAYRIYHWEAQSEWERLAKFVGLVACGSYLTHLAMDLLTSRSLPLVGKL